MRSGAATRARGRRDATAGGSLFPFLAVLICTMGALIVLLVVLSGQARIQAAVAAERSVTDTKEDVSTAHEMVKWRIAQLKESREKTEANITDARLKLGHLEEHIRTLKDTLRELELVWDKLKAENVDSRQRRGGQTVELARLAKQIERTKRALDTARSDVQKRKQSYAIVPYKGPNGTARRPIYIECRENCVVLQPEGVVLAMDDFDGPLGPGNPLDSGLMAIREHMLASAKFNPEEVGELYPLLLVRPDGIMAYYAARAAMVSWGSEFGYELIGDNWELEYRPADSRLAEDVRRAVGEARERQKRLAIAAPRHYRGDSGNGGGRPVYRVSPTGGGIIRDGTTPRSKSYTGRRSRKASESRAGLQQGEWQPKGDANGGGQAGKSVTSLAKTRGRDWGLPDGGDGSVPITRPIRIECLRDRLVVVPELGAIGSEEIRMIGRTEGAIDDLIAAIWNRTNTWGIAGRGMYWKPVLNIYVAPDADNRYNDLRILLDDSGLNLRRKGG